MCLILFLRLFKAQNHATQHLKKHRNAKDKLTKNCLAAAHINRQSNVLTAPLMRIIFSERKGEENATVRLCSQTQDKL